MTTTSGSLLVYFLLDWFSYSAFIAEACLSHAFKLNINLSGEGGVKRNAVNSNVLNSPAQKSLKGKFLKIICISQRRRRTKREERMWV